MVEKCGNSKIICTGALDKENIYGNLYSELATVSLAWLRNNPKMRIFVVSHDREPESHSQTGPPVSDTKKKSYIVQSIDSVHRRCHRSGHSIVTAPAWSPVSHPPRVTKIKTHLSEY